MEKIPKSGHSTEIWPKNPDLRKERRSTNRSYFLRSFARVLPDFLIFSELEDQYDYLLDLLSYFYAFYEPGVNHNSLS